MKRYERATVWSFLAVLFGFALLFWIAKDRVFSEQENRSLQTLPAVSAADVRSGKFSSEMNDYFSDQFPLRDALVGIKGFLELSFGKGENDGILLGKNGVLARRRFSVQTANGESISDCDGFDPAHVQNACLGIHRASENLTVPFAVLLTGRNVDVAASAFDYPQEHSDALLREIENGLSDGVQTVDTVPLLREKFDGGEAVYYKTDHHWTTLGAYYAYAELLKSFGMEEEILPSDAFEKRVASDSFCGTLWSAGGMKWVAPDAVEFWLLGNEDAFLVVADGKPLEGFYSEKWLSKKDCYSAFLDGTHDVVTVTRKDGTPRPKLLILKDSFANSVAPFLAQHFDLVLLNLSSTRQDFTALSELAAAYEADRVTLIYTVENLITSDKLCRLR